MRTRQGLGGRAQLLLLEDNSFDCKTLGLRKRASRKLRATSIPERAL